jgi:ribosomal-protein-alanine N-acetyltransferase
LIVITFGSVTAARRNVSTDVNESKGLSLRKPGSAIVSTDWRQQLPILSGRGVTLRELKLEDAATLLEMLTTEEVSRFISPPPTTVEGFEKFIAWTHRQRAAGQYVCFGIVPHGKTRAVGLFQLRSMEPGFGTAEWGFVLGSSYWGTGVFMEGAELVMDYSFETIGAFRLEARSSVQNGRGNGALQKLGATCECILRSSFLRNGLYHDQILWSIVASDWREWMQDAALVRRN